MEFVLIYTNISLVHSLPIQLCLVFNVNNNPNPSCCTRTDTNQCVDSQAARRRCPMLSASSETRRVVNEMRSTGNNNKPFYDAYTEAWRKATTVGSTRLFPLVEECGEQV